MKHGNEYPGYDTWPELRGLVFVTADGAWLCPQCANRKNGSLAFADTRNTAPTIEDRQWQIIGAQMHVSSERFECGHCGQVIAPAIPSTLWHSARTNSAAAQGSQASPLTIAQLAHDIGEAANGEGQ